MIPPSQIIPLAEESGLIVAIDRRMLELVCADALRLPTGLEISINLSAAHFLCDDIVPSIAGVMARSGVDPRRIALEITESIMLTDEARTRDVLARLRSLGVAIALDDFGSGFSSLAYLRRFRFDKLKVDKAFIDDLDANVESFEILRAIANLGASPGDVGDRRRNRAADTGRTGKRRRLRARPGLSLRQADALRRCRSLRE